MFLLHTSCRSLYTAYCILCYLCSKHTLFHFIFRLMYWTCSWSCDQRVPPPAASEGNFLHTQLSGAVHSSIIWTADRVPAPPLERNILFKGWIDRLTQHWVELCCFMDVNLKLLFKKRLRKISPQKEARASPSQSSWSISFHTVAQNTLTHQRPKGGGMWIHQGIFCWALIGFYRCTSVL